MQLAITPPVNNEDERERLTLAIGRELFARLDRQGPLPFTPAWFDERLMELSMGDPALKVQLFRFIDVLPVLETPETISGHLREYLNEAGDALPGLARFGLRHLPRRGLPGKLLAKLARSNAQRLARRFIAGSNVEEALATIAQLRKESLAFTIDLLGEATITEVEAGKVQAQYLELIEGLSRRVNAWPAIPLIDRDHHGPIPRVNVSLKLSALFSQFDPIDPAGTSRAVRDRLRPILRLARQRGAFVNVDMEQYSYKDATLRIFREVLEEPEFRDWPDVGIAMQAYLRDTEDDLHALLAWVKRRGTPVWVRLIKGAYWDYETVIAAQADWPVPVFTEKWETDVNYEKLTRFLLEHYEQLRPAFGSHNFRSLAHAMATAKLLGLPRGAFEIQLLYGMAGPIKDVLAAMGQRVRIYTPYGQLLPGMAYLVRRLLENTANESFLRASFKEHVPEEKLLMNPLQHNGVHVARPLPTAGKPEGLSPFTNEPLADFSKEATRAAMQAALAEVKGHLRSKFPAIINNAAMPMQATLDEFNPSHQRELIGKVARTSVAQAEPAIQAAKTAFPAWRDTEPARRAQYLFDAAGEMRRRRFELSAWEVYECGKPWREADADIAEAIDFCEYYGRRMIELGAGRNVNLPGEENANFYEPRGVSVVIAPWNFPLAILCGMTTAALVTGNTVIMKPAEQSAIIAAKLMEVFQAVGLPPGVLNYLPGVGEEIGPTLVNHPDVALIAFTGSQGVGLHINQEAAKTQPGQDYVKRVIAEMGGKNAIIIDDDADMDEAVHGVVASAFGYSGQKCSACSRAIVLASKYDSFLERLVEATRSLTVAPAEDPGCGVGPVIDGEARNRILKTIEQGKKEARLVYAADLGPLANEGHFVGPHIFADVLPNSALAQEEIFGPVLAVMKAADLDEALRIANGTRFALTGGFFSRSPENLKKVKRQFRVGNLYINRKITGALVNRQPFGGFKMSGIGSKAGGPDYLLQFLLPRTITENTMRRGFAPEGE